MNKATVADVMTTDVVTLSGEQDVVFATVVMKLRRIRHLPVVQGDKLIGMLSHRDLLRAQARFLEKIKEGTDKTYASVTAKEAMSDAEVRTVGPDMPASKAAMILVDEKIGCVPVVRDGTLVGIATEADFLRWAVSELG